MNTNESSTEGQRIEDVEGIPLAFHPFYNFADGDVILQGSDGLCFKVHKLILRISSDFFDTMFGLPQHIQSSPDIIPIPMEEHCGVIRVALDIIYPSHATGPIESLEIALLVCEMAEKYQFKKVKETICASLSNKRAFYGALENFLIACKYGSDTDKKTASTATLGVNLYDSSSEKILKRLDDTCHLQLYLLRNKRRQMLLQALNIKSSSINNPDEKCMIVRLCYRLSLNSVALTYHTDACVAGFDHPCWYTFKYMVSSEMEICSSGATIVAQEFWERHQLRNLWSLFCKRCELPLLDKEGLIYEIKRILELLPDTI